MASPRVHVKERGKSAGVEMADMAAAGSSALPPGASRQLLEEMRLFAMLPHRFPLVPRARCYLGPLLSPLWLLSTLSERSVLFLSPFFFSLFFFNASPRFLSHPNLCYSPQFHSEILKCVFELAAVYVCVCARFFLPPQNDWNLHLDACFKDALLGFL